MNLYEELLKFIDADGDTIEIFGETGSGKSTFFIEACKAAAQLGKKVKIIDSEKNIKPISVPNIDYEYFPSFQKEYKYIVGTSKVSDDGKLTSVSSELFSKNYDVVLLDSLGLRVLGQYARGNMREKGDILLKCHAISDVLGQYAGEKKAIVLLTNQPQSTFTGIKEENTRPFGDKHQFFIKEIWRAWITSQTPDETVCIIKAWRSRFCGKGTLLFTLTITNEGVEIEKNYGELWKEVTPSTKTPKTPKTPKTMKTPKTPKTPKVTHGERIGTYIHTDRCMTCNQLKNNISGGSGSCKECDDKEATSHPEFQKERSEYEKKFGEKSKILKKTPKTPKIKVPESTEPIVDIKYNLDDGSINPFDMDDLLKQLEATLTKVGLIDRFLRKKEDLGGLITDVGALLIVAKEVGIQAKTKHEAAEEQIINRPKIKRGHRDDEYNLLNICMKCNEKKNNISTHTGCCWECDNKDEV